MPLTLELIEKEASPHSKPFLILMYHISHRGLLDILPEISRPHKEMTSEEKESYDQLMTELILSDASKKVILRQIPEIAERAKNH